MLTLSTRSDFPKQRARELRSTQGNSLDRGREAGVFRAEAATATAIAASARLLPPGPLKWGSGRWLVEGIITQQSWLTGSPVPLDIIPNGERSKDSSEHEGT